METEGLLNTPIKETPAIKKVKGASLEKARDMLVTQVTNFMMDPKTFGPLLGKLKNSQLPLDVEVGRNAAIINERAVQQAAEQGFEMPQSAVWTVTDDKTDKNGGIATAIKRQLDVAQKAGAVTKANTKAIAERAYMFAVKEGMRTKHIREGAEAMSEIFSSGPGGNQEEQAAGASKAMSLLASASPSPEEGME